MKEVTPVLLATERRQLRVKAWALALLVAASASALVAGTSAQTAAKTTRVSVTSAGAEADGPSVLGGALSANGRFVVFESLATNLVARDTNGARDIFLHDRRTGTTRRVSVDSVGAEANGVSAQPAISATGRFVAFLSEASNLVFEDYNRTADIFVRDRRTGTTKRVSVSSVSAQGNAGSYDPALSANGRFVAFESDASNLVAGDTNGAMDVFVRDRRTGQTSRVSVNSAGGQANAHSSNPALSADGRFVAFQSPASNLVAGDTNGAWDVFIRDRRTGKTSRVSASSAGAEGNGDSGPAALSANGRIVAFESLASNLVATDTNGAVDVFVRDRRTGTTTRVSVRGAGAQGNAHSFTPALSANGRFVAFWSDASNLVARDTNGAADAFLRDRRTGTTRRISVSSAGSQGNSHSLGAALSANGRFVAFDSLAWNLVAGDTNGARDVFVRGPLRWR